MKVSMSLPGEDVEFLDGYAKEHAFPSRSAVVHRAIQAFRLSELPEAYSEAWAEWGSGGMAGDWDVVVGDGV
jgi:Arc/MetJ-type ribon-helix-helix transcriptional regulator